MAKNSEKWRSLELSDSRVEEAFRSAAIVIPTIVEGALTADDFLDASCWIWKSTRDQFPMIWVFNPKLPVLKLKDAAGDYLYRDEKMFGFPVFTSEVAPVSLDAGCPAVILVNGLIVNRKQTLPIIANHIVRIHISPLPNA